MKGGLVLLLLAAVGLFGSQNVSSGQTYDLNEKSSSYVLTKSYSRGEFEIDLECSYSQPGSILDTIGINGAPVGSWSLRIGADGQVVFGVWDGSKWNQLLSEARIPASKPSHLNVTRRGDAVRMFIGGRADCEMTLAVPLSGEPVFVGDFRGDEHWGSGYNIYQSIIGTVRVDYFGPPRATVAAERVIDRASLLTSAEVASLQNRIATIEKSQDLLLFFTFVSDMEKEPRAAEAKALYNTLSQVAAGKPGVAFVISNQGVSAHYTSTLLQTIGREKIVAAITGLPKAGRRVDSANSILDALFGGGPSNTEREPETNSRPRNPRRPIAGETTLVPAGKETVLKLQSGTITIPAQDVALEVTTTTEQASSTRAPGLQLIGPILALEWDGAVDPHAFTPIVKFPASSFAGAKGVNIVRIGDALVGGELSGDEITVLPTLRTKDGGVMAVDTFTPPTPDRLVAAVGRLDKPAFTTRYGLASYSSALNWRTEPDLVRMVPSNDPYERQPIYKLSQEEAAALKRNPIKNVIVLVHGHNEYEKGGYTLGDASQPWVVQYKRDVWTLFWKQFKDQAKEYTDTTAVYEFIYPSYRPTFEGEMGVDPLGLSLAKAIANDFDISYAADKELSFNLYVVAHSMGGLVARAGVNRFGDVTLRNTADKATILDKWVQKVVTWGTPHHGSPLVTMRYLLTGGYDIQGTGGVLPISLLKQSNAFNVGVNYFAAMDTPGERALKWDNYRPLNLSKAGWVVPKRTVWESGDMEAFDTTFSLDQGSWLYNTPLANFNRADRMRSKVVPFYGVTRKQLAQKGSMWKSTPYETLTGRYSDFSRLINSPQIAQGAYLMKWLYQSDQTVGDQMANSSDGAVPVESMSGASIFPRNRFLGDVDHEEYYGAPADGKWTAESKAMETSAATLSELGFDGDKKGINYPPSLELKQPLPQAPPVGGQAAFSVSGQLTWNGDPKPGLRALEVQLVALDPTSRDLKGKVIPCKLQISESGAVTGTVPAKEVPAASDRAKPTLRVIFKDKKELDSKPAAGPDDILPTLQRTTQFMIVLYGVVQEASEPNLVGTQGAATAASWGLTGNLVAGIIKSAKDAGKPIATPLVQWNGQSFSMNADTGQLDTTSKSRQGTTVVKSSQKLTLSGKYDPLSRSIRDVVLTSESIANSVFTPDPNWKPRDRLEAELGGPKASTGRSLSITRLNLDSIPLAGPPTDVPNGYGLTVSFVLDGKEMRPGCVGFYQSESESTGTPPIKTMRKIILGPQSKGYPYQSAGAYVHFILPKP